MAGSGPRIAVKVFYKMGLIVITAFITDLRKGTVFARTHSPDRCVKAYDLMIAFRGVAYCSQKGALQPFIRPARLIAYRADGNLFFFCADTTRDGLQQLLFLR